LNGGNPFQDVRIFNRLFVGMMMNNSKKQQKNSGFTLIELMVTVTIVGILASISIYFYKNYLDQARLTISINAVNDLKKVLYVYSTEHTEYPTSINLVNFTDQDGNAIAEPAVVNQIKANLFSIDSYVFVTPAYTITAKALDSKHTVITATPENISH
jgi:prepilin-type N-terminal cleavage/methylation domain-containing protein